MHSNCKKLKYRAKQMKKEFFGWMEMSVESRTLRWNTDWGMMTYGSWLLQKEVTEEKNGGFVSAGINMNLWILRVNISLSKLLTGAIWRGVDGSTGDRDTPAWWFVVEDQVSADELLETGAKLYLEALPPHKRAYTRGRGGEPGKHTQSIPVGIGRISQARVFFCFLLFSDITQHNKKQPKMSTQISLCFKITNLF